MNWVISNMSKLGGFLDMFCGRVHDGDMKRGYKYRIVGKVVEKKY